MVTNGGIQMEQKRRLRKRYANIKEDVTKFITSSKTAPHFYL